MITLPTPFEIERLALERGLSIAAMCRRADLDPSIFFRWKAGNDITLGSISRLLDALNDHPTI